MLSLVETCAVAYLIGFASVMGHRAPFDGAQDDTFSISQAF